MAWLQIRKHLFIPSSPLLYLPRHDGLYHQTVSKSKHFPLLAAFAKYFAIATSRVAKTGKDALCRPLSHPPIARLRGSEETTFLSSIVATEARNVIYLSFAFCIGGVHKDIP